MCYNPSGIMQNYIKGFKMKITSIVPLALSGVLFTSSAFAGGFQLSEYSTTNMGRAFAGAGVVGDDYSAIAFNPAGMVLNGSGIQGGANLVIMQADAEGSLLGKTKEKGKIRATEVVPHLFAQYKVNEDLRLGMGVYIPFGLGTTYNSNWFGKNHALKSKVQVIDLNMSAAYNITKELSLGLSVIGERAGARLTNGTALGVVSDMKADSYKMIWGAGIMYRPFENTRFGLSYRSNVAHNLEGRHKIAAMRGDCDAELDLPEHVLFSAYHRIGDFGLSASAKWSKWSRFENLDIYSDIRGSRVLMQHINEEWKDTWFFSGGVDYYFDDKWTFRAGIAYDQTGIKDAEHRTARIPDNDRIIASIGAGYKYNNWQFDIGYSHMFLSDSKANHTITGGGTLQAEYKTQINLFAVSVQYNF